MLEMREELKTNKEETLQKTLEFILLLQLSVEAAEQLPSEVNRQRIKQQSKALIKTIDPIIQIWYDKMFKVDEQVTQSICFELESLVKQISSGGLEQKVFISQALEAFRKDKKSAEKEIHKIITN